MAKRNPERIVVWKMIKKFLEDNGYDGLYSQTSQCACTKDQCILWGRKECLNCLPGYKAPDETRQFKFTIKPCKIPYYVDKNGWYRAKE